MSRWDVPLLRLAVLPSAYVAMAVMVQFLPSEVLLNPQKGRVFHVAIALYLVFLE